MMSESNATEQLRTQYNRTRLNWTELGSLPSKAEQSKILENVEKRTGLNLTETQQNGSKYNKTEFGWSLVLTRW